MVQKRIISTNDNYSSKTDIFQIKNFALVHIVKPPQYSSLGTDFVFDGLAIFICLNGECVVKVNYQEYIMKKNQILTIMPYRIVSILRHSEDCIVRGFFLGIDYYTKNNLSGPDYDIILQLKKHPLVTLTTDGQMRHLMELFSVILVRYENINNPYSEECLKALIFAFMAEIKCIYEKNDPEIQEITLTRQEKIANDFFRLLVENFRENRSVTFYADKLCFTPKYLSTVIKTVTGHTIQEWVNEMVVNHSKSLLKTTDKTVLEISEEMNFSSPSFFGRFFKQYAGITPLQFRNK